MKVLSISLDKKILDKNSENFQRQKEYAGLVDKYHVIVFGPEKEIQEDNLFVCGTGGKNKISRFIRSYKEAKRILRDKDLKDWLITTQDPFFCGFLGHLLRRRFSIKLHVQLHGDFFSSKYFKKECLYNRFQYILGKFILKKADGFRVVSQRIKKSLVKLGMDEDRITEVPIYTDVKSQISNLKSQKHGKFIFLTIGRLVPVKNIGLQIRAFAEVNKKYPNAELWIVGDGSEKKRLQATSYKLQAAKNIKFWGWQGNLGKFYKQADVFLLTSNYEGWGLVIIEAASFGLPIIMTDVGCAGEVIRNGESGIVIPVGDKKELEEAMMELIENKELRKRLDDNAKKAILKLSDREETLRLYKKSWELTIKK